MNLTLSQRELLITHHSVIMQMHGIGFSVQKITKILQEKTKRDINPQSIYRLIKEMRDEIKAEKIRRYSDALTTIEQDGVDSLSADPAPGSVSAVQNTTIVCPLQADFKNRYATTQIKSETPESKVVRLVEEKTHTKNRGDEVPLISVEDQIRSILAADKTSREMLLYDPSPKESLHLYEMHKARGYDHERSAVRIELSPVAFGIDAYEIKDASDRFAAECIEDMPSYSPEQLRTFYPDVLRVFKACRNDNTTVRSKVESLIAKRKANLEKRITLPLNQASYFLGITIVSRGLMLAIIQAYEELYTNKNISS